MANKIWTLTGIAVLALVFGASPAVAQTTGEREHAGGQADETEGKQGVKDNAGKIAKTPGGEREHAGGQADETEGKQGVKDNTGKANKQGKSKNKNNGKADKQGQGGAANNPGANGSGTAGTGGTGGATPK